VAKLDDDGNRIIRRMRWDSNQKKGVLIDEDNSSKLLTEYFDMEWEIESEKQRQCDWWESHVLRDGRCVLCGAKYIE
jgi:hypothetical protein